MKIVRAIVTRAGWAAIWYGSEDDKRLEQLEAQVKVLQQQVDTLQTTVQTLQSQLPSPSAMSASVLDPFVSVEPGTLNGLPGPHIIFTGANFHIRNGSGSTEGNTGLGNLVIGYNEDNEHPITIPAAQRIGSHNLIIGPLHQFTTSGGLVAGKNNTISGRLSSVSGGRQNTASGDFSSVSGGSDNTASGGSSSVSGGSDNTASVESSSVSGGATNTASGALSSVSGGRDNTADGESSSVSGGRQNTARGAIRHVMSAAKSLVILPTMISELSQPVGITGVWRVVGKRLKRLPVI
jgi:hypothetical protein